jgi:hypothetical protein
LRREGGGKYDGCASISLPPTTPDVSDSHIDRSCQPFNTRPLNTPHLAGKSVSFFSELFLQEFTVLGKSRSINKQVFLEPDRSNFFVHIQHCFICRTSDSAVSQYAGLEPRTVATFAFSKAEKFAQLRERVETFELSNILN